MNKIIIANWKANPATLGEAQELFKQEVLAAEQSPNVQTVICPPTEFLEQLSRGVAGTPSPFQNLDKSSASETSEKAGYVFRKPLEIGAQDVFWESKPAFSVSHVLVGHSIQRYQFNNTDEVVNKKLKLTLEAGILPVLLVGERKGESREDVVKNQLEKDLVNFSADQISKILFCYEPVWAISTNPDGRADTPENALQAIKFINSFLTTNYGLMTINYLYGGSVRETNIADFLQYPEINGAVIGRASLQAKEFANILKIAANIK